MDTRDWCIYIFFISCTFHNVRGSSEPLRCHHIEYKYDEKLSPRSNINICIDNKICNRNFTISYVEFPPYSMAETVQLRLHACCGACVNITKIRQFKNITELNTKSLENSADFIYPVMGSLLHPSMYGYYFIPIFPLPDYVYVTLKLDPVFTRLLRSINGAYPLIVICLLMTIVSGFITWLLERWFNEEEFPRGLFKGWVEGIWWSFISMTTVGYGDKTPRSVLGRIYAILWILIGITLFGILTGLLTSAVMDADKPKARSIKNEKVGVLRYRLHDASLVSMHDGYIVETNGTNFYTDLIQLLEMLKKKHIAGLVLDKITYWSVKNDILPAGQNKSYDTEWGGVDSERVQNAVRTFNNDVMTTEKKYPGERQSYGVLVRDKEVYEYFRDAMADNKFVVQMGVQQMLKRSKVEQHGVQEDLFSFSSSTFQVSAAVMSGITLAMSLFGLFYSHFGQKKFVENRSCNLPKQECVKETKFYT